MVAMGMDSTLSSNSYARYTLMLQTLQPDPVQLLSSWWFVSVELLSIAYQTNL